MTSLTCRRKREVGPTRPSSPSRAPTTLLLVRALRLTSPLERADTKADEGRHLRTVWYLCVLGKITYLEIAFHDLLMDFLQGPSRKVNIYW